MLTIKPEIKPNHKLLMLIAQIERLSGKNDLRFQLAENKSDAMDFIQKTSLATLCLDQTTPAQLSHPILSFFKSKTNVSSSTLGSILSEDSLKQSQSAKNCLSMEFDFSEESIIQLFKTLSAKETDIKNESDIFRTSISSFLTHENKRVFTTVSPFLVRKRFSDVVEWVADELYLGEIHPIIIAGTFHLLFLQLHPFSSANHRVALVTTWHLLKNSGYHFVSQSDLIGIFLRDEKEYYSSLKQAERSTFTDWTTMNAWLEYFSAKLFECAANCFETEQDLADLNSLSLTQKKILEIIRRDGVVSREKVVIETGISSSTIKYNLSQLAERGHLKREGNGRSTNYRLFNSENKTL